MEKRVLFNWDKMLLEEILVTPEKTALVVIDVVNDICEFGFRYDQKKWDINSIRKMVENSLLPFISRSKEAQVQIIFVKSSYTPRQFENDAHPILNFCIGGTEGAEFYRLRQEDANYIYTKRQHSALFELPYEEGRVTELHKWLQERDLQQPIIVGVTGTNCVPRNVDDAVKLRYKVILPRDYMASRGQRIEQQLLNIRGYEEHPEVMVVNSGQIMYRI